LNRLRGKGDRTSMIEVTGSWRCNVMDATTLDQEPVTFADRV
jgi:hypothetical protein